MYETDTVLRQIEEDGFSVGTGLSLSDIMPEETGEIRDFSDDEPIPGIDHPILSQLGICGVTNLFGEKIGLTTNFVADKGLIESVSDYTSEDISFYMRQVDSSNVVAIFSPPTRKCLPMRIINFFMPHTESVDNSRRKVIYAPDSVPERSVQVFRKGRDAAPRQIILRERFATVL